MTIDTTQRIILPILRSVLPKLMAQQILGVQPMTESSGLVFNLKHKADYRVWSKKKYKFSRAKWYQAEFNIKYYSEVDEWCAEQFGPHPARPDAWSRWWHKFESSILFRDEKDYVLFMLKWS